MARILAAIATLMLMLPLSVPAQVEAENPLLEADRAAIHDVIAAQLVALQHDDSAQAFSYATPLIQQQFGTPEQFLEMVMVVYPSVYRPRDVQFRDLDATENGPVQTVFFIGPNGDPVLGLFIMRQQPDGSWKVNGCVLTAAPDISI